MRVKIGTKNIALVGGFLVILNLLYPSPFPRKFSLKPGDIAPRDIIAPHTFYVMKTKKELADERAKAEERVLFVLRKDDEAAQGVRDGVNSFFATIASIRKAKKPFNEKRAEVMDLVPSLGKKEVSFLLVGDFSALRDSLSGLLNRVMEQGVVDSIDMIGSPIVVIRGEENRESVVDFLDFDDLPQLLKEQSARMFRRNTVAINTVATLAIHFARPNLRIDLRETLKRKEEASAQVVPTKGIVLRDEMIVRAHSIVTQQVVEKLTSLSKDVGIAGIPTFVGRNLIYIIAILALLLHLHFFSNSLFADFSKFLLLMLLMSVVMGVSSIVIFYEASWYLIPIALFGLLASLLLGTQVAISGVIALTILVAAYSGGGFEPLVLFLFAGTISVFVSPAIKKPSDYHLPILCIAGAYVCTAVGVEVIKLTPPMLLLKSLAYASIGGVGSGFVAFGLLSIFEKIFKITTPLTLLEYSNPDRSILRQLLTYAPGTYHHSIAVATLAEGAARSVGADPLLARAGAYYHDIGKLKKPEYFIENQTEKNPHPKLTPELNARVIISHVREGAEIAVKEGVPKEIVSIITEHHGTTMVELLYAKAKEANEEVNELDFRYPGPKPHTKESAIVMLADTAEAAARSLSNPTPSKIKGIVENTFQKKVDDGQFSKVNLSMEEFERIKDSFIPALVTMFHQRIEYDKNLYKEPKKESSNRQDKA
jgi:putative nucleotidyltransferase with HDIG domain